MKLINSLTFFFTIYSDISYFVIEINYFQKFCKYRWLGIFDNYLHKIIEVEKIKQLSIGMCKTGYGNVMYYVK